MTISRNEIDSELLGAAVLEISGCDAGFPEFERAYVAKYDPRYVVAKVSAEDLSAIHRLEANGFEFIEIQFRRMVRLGKLPDLSRYRYRHELITDEADLDDVLKIAATTFEHDRVTRDPFFKSIGKPDFAGERYRRYVLQSFRRPDEAVYRLVSEVGAVLAFGTHRIVGPDTAAVLLGGVKQEVKGAGLLLIREHFLMHDLARQGIKSFFDQISATNSGMLNSVFVGTKGRIVEIFAVLRKIYPARH